MNLFHGHTGRRLEDQDGHVSYAFIHEGGAVLVLRVRREAASSLENKRVVVQGKWISPTTILAEQVQIDVSSPKASSLVALDKEAVWHNRSGGYLVACLTRLPS